MPIDVEEPFRTIIPPRVVPRAMREPPALSNAPSRAPIARRALLINPFYPKDPHASFGKHVLTPTLALTSVAAATPEPWTVEVWDENLLRGAAPDDPPPRRWSGSRCTSRSRGVRSSSRGITAHVDRRWCSAGCT